MTIEEIPHPHGIALFKTSEINNIFFRLIY